MFISPYSGFRIKRLGYVCNPRCLKEGTETSRRRTDDLGSRLERPIHFECKLNEPMHIGMRLLHPAAADHSDLRCFRLQRRRWRASCDMRRERRPPCRLMYAMVAVLSVRTSMYSPRKCLLRQFKARCTASNSRQLMCQCSWGPVQTLDTASLLNVAPPALGGGICVNHSVPVNLFQGTSCPKERKV